MSGVLLDTNALLWVLADAPSLGARARDALQSAQRVQYSSVSVVEVSFKVMLGKLEAPGNLAEAAEQVGLLELPLTAAHGAELLAFPALARHDPFDRMLLAQATCECLTLLTSDRVLLGLGRDDVVDARS